MNNAANKTRDITNLVVLETMPEHHRGSHRGARNFGLYPHNGAQRVVVDRDTAEQIVADDADSYDHIVDGADVSKYPMMSDE